MKIREKKTKANKLFNLAKSFEVCRIFCFSGLLAGCILCFSFALIKLNFLRDAKFRKNAGGTWQTKMGNLKYIRRDPPWCTHKHTTYLCICISMRWNVESVCACMCVCVSKKFLKAIYFSFHFGFWRSACALCYFRCCCSCRCLPLDFYFC